MDILKQLEQKIQALVSQRNQFREELEQAKAQQVSHEAEVQRLMNRLEESLSENAALAKERAEAAQQLDSTIASLDAILRQLDQQEDLEGSGDLFKSDQ